MKKIVKIITPIAAVLAAALLFTTCKQFLADPEEFLSYWAAEVVPESFSFNPASKKSSDGTECITSASDVTLTLNLRNPKSFSLVMPTSSANAGSVINFPGLNPQPVLGTDYTLQQTSGSRLKLLYKEAFLKNHERKNSNIGVEITLTGEDGRQFSERFSLGLNVNTAPSLKYKGIGKKTVGGEQYYVLILQAQNMNEKIGAEYVHSDIKRLHITKEDGTAADYEIASIDFSAKKFNWKAGSPLLDGADMLETGDTEDTISPLPTGGWLIYYKTDVEVKAAAKSYTFSLIDDKGVSSDPVQVSTAKVKAKAVRLYTMADSEITNSGDPTNPNPIIVGPNDSEVTVKAKTETSGAKITGKVEKQDGSDWTWVADINSNNQNNVDIALPAPDMDHTVFYKINVKAGGKGFIDSAEKNFYFKVTKTATLTVDANKPNAWGKLKTAAENPAGPAEIIIDGEIKATNAAGNFGEITISRNIKIKGKTNKASDKLNANKTTDGKAAHRIFVVKNGATLTLKNLTLTGGRDESTGGGAVLANGNLIITDCDVTDNQTGANGGGLCAMGTLVMEKCTLNTNKVNHNHAAGGGAVFVYINGTHTMKKCTLTGNEAEKGDGGGIYTMGALTMEECILTGNKAISNSGSGGGIYAAGTLNMTNCTLTGNTTNHGSGGVYVGSPLALFTMKGSSRITPSTEAEANTPGKNDVFLVDTSKITIGSALTGTPPVARITPNSYSSGTQVLIGTDELLNSEHGNFTVTPESGQNWKVNNQGKLEKQGSGGSSGATIDAESEPNSNTLWKKLKDAVKNAQAGNVITIRGTINATKHGTDEHENFGEIIIDKNITIAGTTNQTRDILNANKTEGSKPAHRIFVVKSGAKLTLKNLTLKGGIAPSGAGGGGIFIEDGGTVELENCTITDCEAPNNGGGIYTKGTLTIKGGTITLNVAKSGGGIYTKGTTTLHDCTLSNNKATTTSGSSGGGGGVYVGSGTTKFTMKGSSRITPSTGTDANKPGENDVFLSGGNKITIVGGLSGTPPVARITPRSYNESTQVLVLITNSGTNLADEAGKFTVTPKGNQNWYVDSDGKLKKR